LLVFSSGAPRHVCFPMSEGELIVGRGELERAGAIDRRMSRRHVAIGHRSGQFTVEDLAAATAPP
jgi:hypothetical protein